MIDEKGLLIVLSAPSGCGKGELLKRAKERINCFLSVSATTRGPRENETPGVTYHYITNEEFEKMIAENALMEHAKFVDHYYGTPLRPVEENRNKGIHTILEIEVQGALQVRERFPEAILIFMLPPSIEELHRRLTKRGTEDAATIEKRIRRFQDELEYTSKYDYVFVNDDLDEAVETFLSIIQNELRRPQFVETSHLIDKM